MYIMLIIAPKNIFKNAKIPKPMIFNALLMNICFPIWKIKNKIIAANMYNNISFINQYFPVVMYKNKVLLLSL